MPVAVGFPETDIDAKVCRHGNRYWYGYECGLCEESEDGYDAVQIDTKYVDEFIERLNVVVNEREHGKLFPQMISVEYGQKFARIVQDNGTQRFVHCFIDMTNGNVIKSAGWKAPQKDKTGLAVRYNLIDPDSRALCFSKMDPHGGYLYKR